MSNFGILIALGIALISSNGCAVVSTQCLDLHSAFMSQETAEAGLQYEFGGSGSWPGGCDFHLPLHIPCLLFLDYERPPWTVWIDVRDQSKEFESLHVDSIQFSWLETGEEETQTVDKECRFRETPNGYREIKYIFEDRISRVESARVSVCGRIRYSDGRQVPVEFDGILRPQKEAEIICPIWYRYMD